MANKNTGRSRKQEDLMEAFRDFLIVLAIAAGVGVAVTIGTVYLGVH